MSPGRSRSHTPQGDPLADPSLEKPLSVLRALAGDQFQVLGPLGRDIHGEYAFLARKISSDELVVLKRRRPDPSQPADPGTLQIITRLDSSVPPPAGSCPVCQAPFVNWEPVCPDCGSNVAGGLNPASGAAAESALAAVRHAAKGYEVFGTMARAVGGSLVYFARDVSGGHLVALRLEAGNERDGSDYSITATRMMRPKMLYGAVGGEGSRAAGGHPGAWTPVPSPALPMPLGEVGGGGGLLPGQANGKVCPQCGQAFGADLRLCPRDGTALRPVAVTDGLIGRIIADRYHIVDRLGQGGMGTVYLAEHVRMGRRCAVKVMNSTLLNDPDSLDRFTREAKNASQLNHPHVAAIYDFGETADGIVYLAMEFVEGESLAAVLDRLHPLPEPQALELASQVADGLGAAHEMGIVHRDLKPDNIMVYHSKSGKLRVKVVDFGIAKATQGDRQTVTRTGYVVGTPAYMSPEQILGDPLDGRSDLYSLGCILYEMLTGQRAFAGESGEVSIRRRLTEPPPRPRSIKQALSKSLDGIVTRAMARAPEQRFQSAADLRDALLGVLNEHPRKGKWPGWLHRARSESSSHSDETPLVPRTPNVNRREPLISPAPLPAAAPLDSDVNVPSPAAWSGSVGPTMRLRHRSVRSEGSYTGWVIGGALAATVTGVATILLVSGGGLAVTWSRVRDVLPRLATIKPRPTHVAEAGPIVLPDDSTSTKIDSVQRKDSARVGGSPQLPNSGLATPAIIRLGKPLPPDARITVDTMETTPSADGLLTVAPGTHVVRVRAQGYRPARRTLPRMEAGDTATLDLVLLPVPLPPANADQIDTVVGAIVVRGDLPSGSVIRVDGRVATPGTRILTVKAGSHWVALSVPGFQTDSSLVAVEQGSWSDWAIPTLAALSDSGASPVTDSALPTIPEAPDAAAPTADSTPGPR